MVLRSIPVTRSIWRWLLPASNSVAIVVCRCGFKTFNPVSLKSEGVTVTSCQGLTEAMKNGVRPPSHQGRGGGIWGGHKWGSLGGHQGDQWASSPTQGKNVGLHSEQLACLAPSRLRPRLRLLGDAIGHRGGRTQSSRIQPDKCRDALEDHSWGHGKSLRSAWRAQLRPEEGQS